jgi:hypothetical protein
VVPPAVATSVEKDDSLLGAEGESTWHPVALGLQTPHSIIGANFTGSGAT